jgi:hypothetical protein
MSEANSALTATTATSARAPSQLSRAPTTTTVMHKRLEDLTAAVTAERLERQKAQDELAQTCKELNALERVFLLRK